MFKATDPFNNNAVIELNNYFKRKFNSDRINEKPLIHT